MARQKLPLGIQNFEELRKGDYLYLDRTDMLWKIANGEKYNFLSRPRRFGKSMEEFEHPKLRRVSCFSEILDCI